MLHGALRGGCLCRRVADDIHIFIDLNSILRFPCADTLSANATLMEGVMARGCSLFLLAFGIFMALIGALCLVAFAVQGNINANQFLLFLAFEMIGVVILIISIRSLRRTKLIGGTTSVFEGRAGQYLADTTETFEIDGSPYTVHYQTPVSGKNGRPSSLVVSTPAECDYEFQITGETWFDKYCKNIGLAVEIQTGDTEFDETCYVRSDSVAFTEAYLSDPIKRVAIVDLRRLGFPELNLGHGAMSAKWLGFDPNQHDKPDLATDAATRLVLLSRNLPPPQPEFEYRTGQWRRQWQFLLWAFLIVFALTVISLAAYPPTHFEETLLWAAGCLAVGLPVFAFLSAMLLRGTSRSHNAWSALMIGAIFLFPVGSLGTVSLVNGVTDASQPVVHDVLIIRKYTTKSKNSTNYHVECQSWRGPGITEKFSINSASYTRVVEGKSKLRATTRAGGLGIEWLVSKHVLN